MKPIAHLSLFFVVSALLAGCNTPEAPVPEPGPEQIASEDPVSLDPSSEPGQIHEGDRPEGDYTLSPYAIFLTDSFVETITGNNPYDMLFETSSADLPKPGQILIYNQGSPYFPEGILLRVTRVEPPSVYYEEVALEEAFPRMAIDTTDIDLAGHLAYVLDGNGNPVEYTTTKAMASASFEISIPSSTWEISTSGVKYDGTEANLKMTLNPAMRLTLGLRFQVIIDDGEVEVMNALLDPSIHLGATISAFGELAAEKSFPLYTFYFNPIPVGPLVFVPKITLEGYMKVDGSVGVEASVSFDKKFTIGAAYETGDWRPVLRGMETEGIGSNPAQFGTKVEGGVSFGLRPALEFRLYDIIGAAIGTDVSIRSSVSHKLNLDDPESYNTPLNDVSFSTALNIKGTLAFNAKVGGTVLYEGFNFATPELNYPLYEAWLMPEICTSTLKIEPNATGARITGMLKKNVLIKGNLYARVFDPADWSYEDTPDGGYQVKYNNERYCSVDWTAPSSAKDSTAFEVVVSGFDPGVTYQVDFMMSIPGSEKYTLRGNSSLFFRTFNETQAKQVATLVSNVANAMGWVDTPWYEVSPWEVMFMEDQGIHISTSYEDGRLMWVDLYPDPSWPLPSSINIGESVGASLDDNQWYNIAKKRDYTEEELAGVTSVVIKDPKCGSVPFIGPNITTLEIHSPHWIGYFEAYGHPRLQTADFSGSGILEFQLGRSADSDTEPNPFNLKKVVLDNCTSLKRVSCEWPYIHDLPQLSLRGCTALKDISLEQCTVNEGSLQNLGHFERLISNLCSGTLAVPADVDIVQIYTIYDDLSVVATNSSVKVLTMRVPNIWETETEVRYDNVTLSGLSLQDELSVKARNISITSVDVPKMYLSPSESVRVISCPGLRYR